MNGLEGKRFDPTSRKHLRGRKEMAGMSPTNDSGKFVIGRVSFGFARMHQHCNGRTWPRRRILARVFVVSLLLLVIFNGPFVAAADRLVLLSPHWKGIEDEFERAFKAHHLRETGRTVELEWLDVGGTSEVLRFYSIGNSTTNPGASGLMSFLAAGLNPISLSRKSSFFAPTLYRKSS